MIFPEIVRVSWAQQFNKRSTDPRKVYCSLDYFNSVTQETPIQQTVDIFNLACSEFLSAG